MNSFKKRNLKLPSSKKPFALHALAAVSSGNQTVVDGTFLQDTAPYCSVATGGANGVGVKMCNIENIRLTDSKLSFNLSQINFIMNPNWEI